MAPLMVASWTEIPACCGEPLPPPMVPLAWFVTSPFTTAPSLITTQSALPLLLMPPVDPGPLTTIDGSQANAAPPPAAPTASAEPVTNNPLSRTHLVMHNCPGKSHMLACGRA